MTLNRLYTFVRIQLQIRQNFYRMICQLAKHRNVMKSHQVFFNLSEMNSLLNLRRDSWKFNSFSKKKKKKLFRKKKSPFMSENSYLLSINKFEKSPIWKFPIYFSCTINLMANDSYCSSIAMKNMSKLQKNYLKFWDCQCKFAHLIALKWI